LLLMAMDECVNQIAKTREIFNCPPFKSKDEVVIVEAIVGDNFKAIPPEKLDSWEGEFNRLLPINPDMQFSEFPKGMGGFLNYNGDEKETVEFVIGKGG